MSHKQIYSYPGERPPFYPDLILIGTIHRAPSLRGFLKQLLLEIRPAVVTVEISPFSVRFRQKRQTFWQERLRAVKKASSLPREVREALERAFTMPYEYQIPKSLGLCPVVPIDLNAPARTYLLELEKLLYDLPSPEACRLLSHTKELAFLRLFLKGCYRPPSTAEDRLRETFWAQKIKKLLRLKRPLVHVGGWRHLPGLLSYFPESVALVLEPCFSSQRDYLSIKYKKHQGESDEG